MNIKDELHLFLLKTDELLTSKYILAEIKIVGVLKAIASSKTIMDVVRGSLKNFDIDFAKDKYLVRSSYDSSRGEFVMPENSGDMIALAFSLLMAVDSKELELGEFLKEYFYADGSLFASYNEFLTKVIKPFRNTVKVITEAIIDGKITICEPNKNVNSKTLSEETSVNKTGVVEVVNFLKTDKANALSSKLDEEVITEAITVIDGFLSAIDKVERTRVKELLVAYKYLAKSHKKLKFNYEELIEKLKVGKML
jgi:hypothetical protein